MASGNVDLARELMEWGQRAGFVWPIAGLRKGPGAPQIHMKMLEMLAGRRGRLRGCYRLVASVDR